VVNKNLIKAMERLSVHEQTAAITRWWFNLHQRAWCLVMMPWKPGRCLHAHHSDNIAGCPFQTATCCSSL
jgi:hypothetical protein